MKKVTIDRPRNNNIGKQELHNLTLNNQADKSFATNAEDAYNYNVNQKNPVNELTNLNF